MVHTWALTDFKIFTAIFAILFIRWSGKRAEKKRKREREIVRVREFHIIIIIVGFYIGYWVLILFELKLKGRALRSQVQGFFVLGS
jgi:hypothetical protein